MKIRSWFAITVLCIGISAAALAQNAEAPPATPGSGPYMPLGSPGQTETTGEQNPTIPDTNPLSGALRWTIGENAPNILVPSFQFSEMADTNALYSATNPEPQAVTTLSGGLRLQRTSTAHQFALNYTGGGTFYTVTNNLNSSFQSLGLTEIYTFNRWTLTLADSFSYANQIGYGVGTTMGLAGYFITPQGLLPIYLPETTILTEPTPQINNATVGQVEYHFGPHVSVTAGGSYGLLHYLDADLFNDKQYGGSVGVNYTPNAKDSFALSYYYSKFSYDQLSYKIGLDTYQVRYGRRLTGRYAMEFGAGPQILHQSPAQPGPHLGWNATASISAQMGRTNTNLGYYHTITAGSGVLLGATTDGVQFGVARAFQRFWNVSTQFGYARNAALSGGSGTYNYIFGGATVARNVGRQASVSTFYNVQNQMGDSACTVACGAMRHMIGVGVQWSFRPIQLR